MTSGNEGSGREEVEAVGGQRYLSPNEFQQHDPRMPPLACGRSILLSITLFTYLGTCNTHPGRG